MEYKNLGLNIKTITLTLTQACNLNCTYCYENHKSSQTMNFETAKKIIDYEFLNIKDFDGLEIDLFGGEPFLEFDLIKKITEYTCKTLGDFPHTIFLTTNGTLVHGEIQEWLKEHKNCVVCGLSLDGTREMHNINRSNSFDSIDVDFFVKNYPDQEIKMTISQETLPMLSDGVIFAHNKGFDVSCNLAYGIDWSNDENTSILDRELHKLIDFYLKNSDIVPCSMLSLGITNVLMDELLPQRYCGAGISMKAYDVDGRDYPCQFFMPLSVGEEKSQISKNIIFYNDDIPIELIDEKCRTCVINSCCPNCYGSNYASTGNIYSRDDNMCKLTKIIIRACSYFYAMQWINGQLKDDESEIQLILRSIDKIQKHLQI